MFYKSVEEILNESNLELKFSKFKKFYSKFRAGQVEFEENFQPKPLNLPSYAKICQILPPKDLPKFKGDKKIPAFLHSILHIEYSAIDIALDDCYRFVGLPFEYYVDFLEICEDEIRHFSMIEKELLKFGFKYGDFAVHDGLFFALKNTSHSLAERMAILHKYSEANGLDANYFILKKIDNGSLKELLEQILEEEISHVKKGNKWFDYANKDLNLDFLDIVLKHYPKFKNYKRELNEVDRIRAGFSQDEILKLKNY
ncbi:ferritin-like domain-containing protein [Campylobacter sp. FMV-PI01]|uniref:Ferritin-like domain-containing protein n=2 Tax=Campylobacter portucalensis TaxID=2608384 RepID=A0A6L5WK82_9BACT|nr:ferritin-like domain-containing protein [Campylobacter portucalensis]